MEKEIEIIYKLIAELRKENLTLKGQILEVIQLNENLLESLDDLRANPEKEFLTSKEVCEYLGISDRSRCRYQYKGIITPEKIGGKLLYRKSELTKALKS